MPPTTPTPLITVITPAYNVEAYILEAIDSVLAQTEDRFEYLIVDDGSTDRTVELIESRVRPGGPVRLIRADHGGNAAARNRALHEARGSFIAFLDGDDRWHPTFLARQLQLLQSLPPEVGAVFCRARVISDGGHLVALRWQAGGRVDFDDMLIYNCPPRNGSSLLLKKRVFADAGEFDTTLNSGVDFDMWLRIGLQAASPIFWGSTGYLLELRIRSGQISGNLASRFETMTRILDTYVPQLRRKPAGLAYIRPALLAFRAGYDEKAEAWTKQAMTAGLNRVLSDQFGSRVLGWAALPKPLRSALRAVKGTVRQGVLDGAGKLGGAARR